MIYNASRMC